MNYKTTYILFGILVAILVLVGIGFFFAPVNEGDTGRYLLPSANQKTTPVKVEDVVKVQVERTRPDAVTMVFERESADSKNWTIAAPLALRANTSRIESLVSQALAAEIDPRVDVPPDLKAAELDPPAETVTLTTKAGKELKVNVGAESPLSTSAVVYLDSSEKPAKPMPVLKSSVEALLKPLNYFRDAHLLAAATADYRSVQLTLDKVDKKDAPKGALVLERKKDDALWRYKDPEGYDGSAEAGDSTAVLEAGKPPSGVDPLVRELSNLQVESGDADSDWVADDPKPEDLAKYNLDPAKSDVLTIKIERALTATGDETQPMTLLVGIGKKVDDKTNKYYAEVKDEKHAASVVKIATTAPDAIALLFKDPGVLCNRNLAALGGFKKPLAVDLTNAADPEPLHFRREKGEDLWRLFRADKEIAVDSAAVDSLVSQMVQGNQVREFLNPPPAADKDGLDKPAAVMAIWTEGVKKEEPPKKEEDKKDEKKEEKKDEKKDEAKPKLVLDKDKADKPAARLSFGNVEGDLVVVKREANHTGWSESAVVKAPKLLSDQARAGALTYYDKALPKFQEGFNLPDKDVVKLQLDHDGEHYVISRADPTKPEWKFEEPKELADRKVDATAVEGALAALADLRATSLVNEAPKEDDLDKLYGLKTPSLIAVVTKKDDKNSPYTYRFGKDAPDGGVYAQQSQRPMVFVVGKNSLDALKRDPRDRTIFAFDPAKVKTLKMSGWQKKSGGQVLTRDLERKDDKTWIVKDPPNIQVNSDKVNKVVADLSKLTAERFVSHNAAIKTEYDKEEPKNGFTFEMKVEDAPYVLKVIDLTGDQTLPEADRQVYATSPQLPGELFQVRRSIFTAPAGMPMQIGPIDEAGYFSP